MSKKNKLFSQDALVQDLYELFHNTLEGATDPKTANAATGASRAIGQQLNIKHKLEQAKRATKKKAK